MRLMRLEAGREMLADLTGSIDPERLRRNECLAAENRILRARSVSVSDLLGPDPNP